MKRYYSTTDHFFTLVSVILRNEEIFKLKERMKENTFISLPQMTQY